MKTPNIPRSGIVPPLVTASRWAPGRPVRVPCTRSQTRRGRSSANSSLGYRPVTRSSVASNAERGRPLNGALRRTRSNQCSTSIVSTAPAATVCCARTSSGFAGTEIDSICPLTIRSTVTALLTRSARCFGNSTPWETSPTWCPARPTRCSPLATDGGASTWMTRSTSPMSMPSSSELVATTQRSRPDFRSSSMIARWSLDTEPWWARASTGTLGSEPPPSVCPDPPTSCAGGRFGWATGACADARPGDCATAAAPTPAATGSATSVVASARSSWISLSRAVRRSASRRELAKTIVDRCCSMRSTTDSSTCGQIDPLVGLEVASAPTGGAPRLGHVVDGDDHAQVEGLLRGRRDDLHGGATAEEPGDLLRRTHGGGQADALHGLLEQVVEALERHGEVGAALRGGHRVHLVDDDRVDVDERFAGLRREHEVERLGRRDEDVRREPQEPLPVG